MNTRLVLSWLVTKVFQFSKSAFANQPEDLHSSPVIWWILTALGREFRTFSELLGLHRCQLYLPSVPVLLALLFTGTRASF